MKENDDSYNSPDILGIYYFIAANFYQQYNEDSGKWLFEKGGELFVTVKKTYEQVHLQDVMPELQEKGIIKIYDRYKAKIENEVAGFFHNAQGIHGVAHAKRVLFLALLLSEYNHLEVKDRDLLILAAVYHDIGRKHDKRCEVHGLESVKKLENEGLCRHLSSEDKKILYFMIENHCISDTLAWQHLGESDIEDKGRAKNLLSIFKDSDGLDRCRIHDLDIHYLRNDYSFKLPQLACELLQVECK